MADNISSGGPAYFNLYGKGSRIACNRPNVCISDTSVFSVVTARLQVKMKVIFQTEL